MERVIGLFVGGFLFAESVLFGQCGLGRLNSPREQQDDEDDDDKSGPTSQIVIAGAETITAAAEQQKDEKKEQDVHEDCRIGMDWS